MPYVSVRIVAGRTQEQKDAIIKGVTEVISKVLEKNPEATYVVIDDVPAENWGIGGESIFNRKSKQK